MIIDIDGKKFRAEWSRNNLAAIDWHPDGWHVAQVVPDGEYDYFHHYRFVAGAKDMPQAELVNAIRAWQKRSELVK